MGDAWEQQRQEAIGRLADYGRDFAGIVEDCCQFFARAGASGGFEALRTPFTERYRRLFTPEGAWATAATTGAGGTSPAYLRWQRASREMGEQTALIATDAFERLSAALTSSDPEAAPITSLRALHDLWIECGEAAYAAVARTTAYAQAQSELLAAIVEWRAELAGVSR
ncbi:MAG: poly(R)-hydroxyalkanoic acid synthase subunit PhaE [Steroidobacteraceae bacterium]